MNQSLSIGIVGAGRVGAVLGTALRGSGHQIIGASGSSAESLERIDTLLSGVPVMDPDEVVKQADLVLFTVPDDALEPLIKGLATLGVFRPGQLLVHTAGRFGAQVFGPATQTGAIGLAIHPAMTFTGTSLDVAALTGAPFGVTAPTPFLPIGQALVIDMGGEPVVIAEEHRELYHAALAHGANHLVTLVGQTVELLDQVGIAEPGAYARPLIEAAADRALRNPDRALTGPVMRGDAGTLAAHMTTLHNGSPEREVIADTYAALAGATIRRRLAQGLMNSTTATKLLDALSGYGGENTDRLTIAHTPAELKAAMRPVRTAVVMTMGALHEGHLSLIRKAREHAEQVVVTIFVNPLQFGPGEDYEKYPRTLEADVAALRAEGGVDVVYAPDANVMYPTGDTRIKLSAGPVAQVFEGQIRPGHFDGMLTVVNKLLNQVQPDVAIFGQKDAQQLALIRQMVADLNMEVQIVAAPIVREADGLALSSRNVYLSEQERKAALAIPRAVFAAMDAMSMPQVTPRHIEEVAREELGDKIEVEYVAVVDPDTFTPSDGHGEALLIIAARVGQTRLIDNALLDFGQPPL